MQLVSDRFSDDPSCVYDEDVSYQFTSLESRQLKHSFLFYFAIKEEEEWETKIGKEPVQDSRLEQRVIHKNYSYPKNSGINLTAAAAVSSSIPAPCVLSQRQRDF
jgi:hypothetical protein